jgi:hypothetical protein
MEVQEMALKDESGLEGHDSGGVKIAARREGVFCFADGTIVLTNEAVRDIAAMSEASKAAAQKDRNGTSRSGGSRGSWRSAGAMKDEQSRAGYER